MVTDRLFRRLRKLLQTETTLANAADKAGLDHKTARKYRRLGELPSEGRSPIPGGPGPTRSPTSGPNSEEQLRLNPGLEAKTLFADLQRRFPGRFADGQLRTLQRRVKQWRACEGPAKEVFFAQVHHPGRLCRQRLHALHRPGRDHRRRAVRPPDLPLRADLLQLGDGHDLLRRELREPQRGLAERPVGTGRRAAAASHRSADGGRARRGTKGRRSRSATRRCCGTTACRARRSRRRQAHENGDVEQSHHQFKRALDQALMLRGSRDFASRADVRGVPAAGSCSSSATPAGRGGWRRSWPLLRPLPARRLEVVQAAAWCGWTAAAPSTSSGNIYSVASRLIGEWVEARCTPSGSRCGTPRRVDRTLPRLRGRGKHRIDYRHVIDWLVRKPGAFADYRYRDGSVPVQPLPPGLRRAARAAAGAGGQGVPGASCTWRRARARAAVEAALRRLLDGGRPPSVAAVDGGVAARVTAARQR